MKTLMPFPSRYMRSIANASFRDHCDLYRNDGYGWFLAGSTRCTVHHQIRAPSPGDPADASAAESDQVEIAIPIHFPMRIGDHVHAHGKRWTVGDGNFAETYASYLRLSCSRPTAATPRIWITLRRFNPDTQEWDSLSPQLVHVAWSKNQPDRLGGLTIRQFGWIFAPEDAETDLDVEQGDTFYYGGANATVQWVPPDPTERREATFFTNLGEGT